MPGEPNLLVSMGVNPGGEATNLGGRNYDYTLKYRKDKPGTEGKENARVWSVYLDEAENHDADVIQGYRNITDSLLVVAALFSGVVTTFVVQTSSALQIDNAQITASLLFETNQLLRAAANGINVNSVLPATLAPGSPTHSSTDIWVNGLFFTSLALALSTALLTVLAKQWIQTYTSIVSGDGKTRALIHQFRFQGIQKWQLGGIIEALPLILHGSMAIFLIGLALHVSQLSAPICGIVASITIITFLFYFGTALLPAIYIDCPYRVPSIFPLAQFLVFAFRAVRWSLFSLLKPLDLAQVPRMDWSAIPADSNLNTTEHKAVFADPHHSDELNSAAFWENCQLACSTLHWLFEYSSNQSVKEIVAEGISGLLNEWKEPFTSFTPLQGSPMISYPNELLKHNIFAPSILISLDKLLDEELEKFTEESLQRHVWPRLTHIFSQVCSTQDSDFKLLIGDLTTAQNHHWHVRLLDSLKRAYLAADRRGDHVLSKHLLALGGLEMLRPSPESHGNTLLHDVAYKGSGEGIRLILKRKNIIHELDDEGWSVLHYAAMGGNLNTLIACVEQDSSLITLKSVSPETPLNVALQFGHSDIVEYLLAHGAEKTPCALHRAVYAKNTALVQVLMETSPDLAEKDEDGKTCIDIANSLLPEAAHGILALLQPVTSQT